MRETVCTVIVTYNRLETLKKSFEMVRAQSLPSDMIVIVDNGSDDGTKDFLFQLEKQPGIQCVYVGNNIGYAGGIAHGINYGMSIGGFDYFWVMDDDSFHKQNTLEELVVYMRDTSYGMMGLSGAMIRMGTKYPITPVKKVEDADYVLIDGALIRTYTIQAIGVPDEKFFMMCEDHEYCKRIVRNGEKVGLLNIGEVERLYMGSKGSFTKATLWRGYYQSRNHILILKEYFSWSDLAGYIIKQAKLIVAAALFAPDRFRRVKFRFIGIWHGLRGIGGKTLDPVSLRFLRHPYQINIPKNKIHDKKKAQQRDRKHPKIHL